MIEIPPLATRPLRAPSQLRVACSSPARHQRTWRSYTTGWRQFTAHANRLGLGAVGAHPALVATFLGTAKTLGSRSAAIRFFHREAGPASPTDDHPIAHDLLEGAWRADAIRGHGCAQCGMQRYMRCELLHDLILPKQSGA